MILFEEGHHNCHGSTSQGLTDEKQDVAGNTWLDGLPRQVPDLREIELRLHSVLDGGNLRNTKLQQLAMLNMEDSNHRRDFSDTSRMDDYNKTPS